MIEKGDVERVGWWTHDVMICKLTMGRLKL